MLINAKWLKGVPRRERADVRERIQKAYEIHCNACSDYDETPDELEHFVIEWVQVYRAEQLEKPAEIDLDQVRWFRCSYRHIYQEPKDTALS